MTSLRFLKIILIQNQSGAHSAEFNHIVAALHFLNLLNKKNNNFFLGTLHSFRCTCYFLNVINIKLKDESVFTLNGKHEYLILIL